MDNWGFPRLPLTNEELKLNDELDINEMNNYLLNKNQYNIEYDQLILAKTLLNDINVDVDYENIPKSYEFGNMLMNIIERG